MKRIRTDVVILGSGFAGALLALMLRGEREAVLVERGSHPRFALGESSTPLANLALEEIARDYDLPWLLPLAEYGSWKKHYPHLVCGLKRGFTFAGHEAGQKFSPRSDHANELLVTASPADDVADTQWLRADFDQFLVMKAVEAGIPYFDRTALDILTPGEPWHLTGSRDGEAIEVVADFVVDATGPGGALARALRLEPVPLRTDSWALFSHFDEVELWQDIVAESGGTVAEYPYHADAAALHHVFDDGWMYVLRFDTGLVSAGFLLNGTRTRPDLESSAEQEWMHRLSQYPSVARQFGRARAVRPFERTPRLQRFYPECVGDDWALLPSAAYTMDALFSTGIGHSLTAAQRLARILIERRERPALREWYAPALRREVDYIDRLVSGAYRAMPDFGLFASWAMLYFAGAIAAEERRRRGEGRPSDEFLSSHLPELRRAVEEGVPQCHQDILEFQAKVAAAIAPINTTGLCDPAKRNLYPY